MFVNFSNHPSAGWGVEQREAAEKSGAICDMPFPAVPPKATGTEIEEAAEKIAGEILSLNPDAVLCQGEFTLSYAVIRILRENNIKVVAACSERKSEDIIENGSTVKKATFSFVGFREYI